MLTNSAVTERGLPAVRFVLFLIDTVNDFLDKNCPYIAGAISFYTLFSIFPLFLAIVAASAYGLGPGAEQEQLNLARSIAHLMPVSSQFVNDTMESIIRARAITGIASILGLLWVATTVFGAIRKGINAAWGIKKTRPFLKERLIDFALVIGAAVIVGLFLLTGPAMAALHSLVMIVAPESEFFNTFMWGWLDRLLLPGLSFLTFLILYSYLPNTRVPMGHVWPGALLASVAFDLANSGFIWFVRTYPSFHVLYGSVSALLTLLTWVYLSAMIVLFGALVTSRYASYVASIPREMHSLKLLCTGFFRVRLKVVEKPGPA
ncbi:MAG: YihY/virulence factor BrkB family protein [SAR202 cluster bacterium]|nr:YihY/virulence factor BrkB family protein [SAR202 cluster bacterium]